MRRAAERKIRSVVVLLEVRKSVSELLGKPFTERVDHQAFKPDQRILAFWAADCAEHVLPYFEDKHPDDDRPREAIRACRRWAVTGEFRMAEIRKVSLDAHAAAREAEEDDAIAAARAAGQAVATAHVPTHSLGCSVYGMRAAAAHSGDVDDGLVRERNWQLGRLRKIAGSR